MEHPCFDGIKFVVLGLSLNDHNVVLLNLAWLVELIGKDGVNAISTNHQICSNTRPIFKLNIHFTIVSSLRCSNTLLAAMKSIIGGSIHENLVQLIAKNRIDRSLDCFKLGLHLELHISGQVRSDFAIITPHLNVLRDHLIFNGQAGLLEHTRTMKVQVNSISMIRKVFHFHA